MLSITKEDDPHHVPIPCSDIEARLATLDEETQARVARLTARGEIEDKYVATFAHLEQETVALRREETRVRDDFDKVEECQTTLTVSLARVEDVQATFESKADEALSALRRDISLIQKNVTEKLDTFGKEWEAAKDKIVERSDRMVHELRTEIQESMQQMKEELLQAKDGQTQDHSLLAEQVEYIKKQARSLVQKADDADSKASNLFDGVDAQFVEHESSYKSMEDQLRKLQPKFTQAMKGMEDQLSEIRKKMEDLLQNKAMLETKVYSLEEFEVRCSNVHRQLEDKLSMVQQGYRDKEPEIPGGRYKVGDEVEDIGQEPRAATQPLKGPKKDREKTLAAQNAQNAQRSVDAKKKLEFELRPPQSVTRGSYNY